MRGGCCGLGRRSGDCGLAGECLDFSKQILLHHNDICNGNLAILVYVCCLLCGLVAKASGQAPSCPYQIEGVDGLVVVHIPKQILFHYGCAAAFPGECHQVGQRRVPVNCDLVGGVAFRIVHIPLCGGKILAICLCCGILQILVDAAYQHTGHSLANCHRGSVVGIFRRNRTIAREEALAHRIHTQQVIQLCIGSIQIGSLIGQLICKTQDDAGVCNGHVAAPIIFAQRYAVRRTAGLGKQLIRLCQHCALCLGIGRGGLADGVRGQQGDVAVVPHGCPVHAGAYSHAVQSRFVLAAAGCPIQLCCRPVSFVPVGLVTVFTGGNIRGIGKVEVGILLQVAPCLLRTAQAVLCKAAVHILIKFIRQRHGCTEVSSCSGGNRCNDQGSGLLFRCHIAREVFTGHLVINSAVLPLHFLHPLQLIANLIQNIRNPVAAFRNAACVSIQLRILLVCIQQICYCLCRRYNVSAIVPGIVPAAGNIDLLIGAINGRHGAVACRVTKGAVLNRSAAALQIEHLHAVIQQAAVNIVPDLKGVGGIQAAAGDVVLARGGDLRKITHPVGFVGRAVGLVPGQPPGVNSLLGDSVHNGKFAGTAHIAKYCRFLAVAAIANLVGHNGRLVGSGCGVVHLAVVDQLQGHVIQVNGMLRQSTIRFLNPAVEQLFRVGLFHFLVSAAENANA